MLAYKLISEDIETLEENEVKLHYVNTREVESGIDQDDYSFVDISTNISNTLQPYLTGEKVVKIQINPESSVDGQKVSTEDKRITLRNDLVNTSQDLTVRLQTLINSNSITAANYTELLTAIQYYGVDFTANAGKGFTDTAGDFE